MPAFNAEKTIAASIESVIAQTYMDWELIIIDDGSKDSTPQLILDAVERDKRIQGITFEHNKGIAAARNTGIKKAKGEWIAFLDSDDLWTEDKLKKQLCFAETENAIISYTSTAYINEAGEKSNYILQAKPMLNYRQLLRKNIMSCSSVIIRREKMIDFPKGDMHEDYAVWLQIVKKAGQAHGLDEPLLIYRQSSSSWSGNRVKSAKMIFNTYCAVGFNRITSLVLTFLYAIHSVSKRLKIKRGWV